MLKHKVMKPPVPRWEETFFDKFFKEPEKAKQVSEEDIESRMSWYYIRKDPIDLMIEGHVVDDGGNYQLIANVGLPTMLSIYCTLGKWFDAWMQIIIYLFIVRHSPVHRNILTHWTNCCQIRQEPHPFHAIVKIVTMERPLQEFRRMRSDFTIFEIATY
jgi:hypothetical protein